MTSAISSYRPRAFLATPFSPERAGGEDPGVFARVQESIRAAAELAEVELDHPGDIQAAGVIMEQVLERAGTADVVLAIVTGSNPNVLFEAGFAAKLPLIIIVNDPDKLPFDLKSYRSISYGRPGELELLEQNVAAALQQTLAMIFEKTDPPIEDYLAAVQRQVRSISDMLPEGVVELLSQRTGTELRSIYVPGRLRARSVDEAGQQSSLVELKELLRTPAGGRREHVLIVGIAGSGKTTLLHVLAAQAWRQPQEVGLEQPRLPLLVRLRSIAASQRSVIDERLKHALDDDQRLTLVNPIPAGFISTWTKRTRRHWLFLLDGLDEVPQEDRRDLLKWLGEFLDYCSENGHRAVLTSRPMSGRPVEIDQRVSEFRAEPLEPEHIENLSRKILGPDADQFLSSLDKSRLRTRLQNPLLLTLAAAIFARTGALPSRRAGLLEEIIDGVIERSRNRLDQRLGEKIAAGVRALLERLAVTPGDEARQIVEDFLKTDLDLPEVEAQGRAATVLAELAASSGILVHINGRYRFCHLTFVEYLAACGLRRKFKTPHERDILMERATAQNREVALTFLGVLDDPKEVTRLILGIYPSWWWRTFSKSDGEKHLETFAFVVDCIVDGCRVEPSLEPGLADDLRRLTNDPALEPRAAELLGLLGDRTALIRLAKSPALKPTRAAYALAALYRLGDEQVLHDIVYGNEMPLPSRLAAMSLMTKKPGSNVTAAAVENGSFPSDLRNAAVVMLLHNGRKNDLLRLLREGKIVGDGLNILAVACGQSYDLDVLLEAAQDKQIDEAARNAIGEIASVSTVVMLQKLAADANIDPPLRAAASSILTPDSAADLTPLFLHRPFSPYTKLALALAAMQRNRPACLRICERESIPPHIRFFVVSVLKSSEDIDGLEHIVTNRNAVADARSLALKELFGLSTLRAIDAAASLTADSSIFDFAQRMLHDRAMELLDVVRTQELDNGQLFAAAKLILKAGASTTHLELLRDPGPDPRVPNFLLLAIKTLEGWPDLLAVVLDQKIPIDTAVIALGILHDAHRTTELLEISNASGISATLRALATNWLSDSEQGGPQPV